MDYTNVALDNQWIYGLREVFNYRFFNKEEVIAELIDKITGEINIVSSQSPSLNSMVAKCEYSNVDRCMSLITRKDCDSIVSLCIRTSLYKLCAQYKTYLDCVIEEMKGRSFLNIFDHLMETKDIDKLSDLIFITCIPMKIEGVNYTQFSIRLY